MRVTEPIVIPQKTYENLWITKVNGVFPPARLSVSVNEETGEQTQALEPVVGQVQFIMAPYNLGQNGVPVFDGNPISNTCISVLFVEPSMAT
mgnify:CR=1 FL=1